MYASQEVIVAKCLVGYTKVSDCRLVNNKMEPQDSTMFKEGEGMVKQSLPLRVHHEYGRCWLVRSSWMLTAIWNITSWVV